MTTLYICETCRFSEQAPEDEQGRRGGALLAEQVERLAADDPSLTVRRMRCLMACRRYCVAHIRAPGKMGYVIGDFPPQAESAATLLEYARHYRQSDTGVVPFAHWPEGIKGHFIARVPPLDES